MHKLTDNEYLPTLVEGYEWNIYLRDDGHAAVQIEAPGFMGTTTVLRSSAVILKGGMDEVDVKEIILARARYMVGGYVPWNPEAARIFHKVITDITPPNDDEPKRQSLNEIVMEARGL